MGTLVGTLMGTRSAHPGQFGDSGWEKLARLQSWMLSTLAGEGFYFFALLFKPFLPLPDVQGRWEARQPEDLDCPFRGFLAFQESHRNLA